jgi:tRNA(fMet)-specific endonuclease VapC
MSVYILDTDILQLFQDEHPLVIARVRAIALEDRAISVVSVEEQLSGWYAQLRQAKRPERLAWAYRRLAATVRFLSRVQIVDFDEAAIQRYEQLKKHIVNNGFRVVLVAGARIPNGKCDSLSQGRVGRGIFHYPSSHSYPR